MRRCRVPRAFSQRPEPPLLGVAATYCLRNEQAAKHLLDSIDTIYDRLEVNPFQFAECRDVYLAKRGYREAVVSQMNYIIVFDVRADVVNVVGIFHQLENYQSKL